MASVGSRDRGKSMGKKPAKAAKTNFKQKIGKPITSDSKGGKPAGAGGGPAWKPAKSATTGNYGKAVSAAAKAKGGPAPITPKPPISSGSHLLGMPGGTPGPTRDLRTTIASKIPVPMDRATTSKSSMTSRPSTKSYARRPA